MPASAFVATRTPVDSLSIPEVTPTLPGGFVNYDLYAEQVGSESSIGAVVEAGAFGSLGVLTSSTLGQRAGSDTSVVRLDSTWTRDLPERLETLRVGDSISGAGAWGQAARFGGIKFGTNFATQPTLVTTPLLSAQGEALLPSTVDVFVNGQRVASKDVAPGPFTIDRVPAINGAGQMQVVVTDALGRQQVISQPYYNGPSLLRAGLNEFSLDAGAIREDYATRSNDYGDLMTAGTFRRGITDRFTAEVHAEAESGGARAVGADAAVQVGTFGVATLTAAAGGEDDVGWLGGCRPAAQRAATQRVRADAIRVGGLCAARYRRPDRPPEATHARRARFRPRRLRQPSGLLWTTDVLDTFERRDFRAQLLRNARQSRLSELHRELIRTTTMRRRARS